MPFKILHARCLGLKKQKYFNFWFKSLVKKHNVGKTNVTKKEKTTTIGLELHL